MLLQDVCEDFELADFVHSVAVDGVGWDGKGLKGFPTKLDRLEDLVIISLVAFLNL